MIRVPYYTSPLNIIVRYIWCPLIPRFIIIFDAWILFGIKFNFVCDGADVIYLWSQKIQASIMKLCVDLLPYQLIKNANAIYWKNNIQK